MTLGTWHYAALALETFTRRQSFVDIIKMYAPEMGYALGLACDDVLAGLPDNVDNTVGTLTIPSTYANVVRSVQYLNDANSPGTDRSYIMSPAEEAGLMELDTYVNRDYTKPNEKGKTGLTDAYRGRWLGLDLFVTTNVEGSNAAGHDNVIMQREAFALVMQMKPTPHQMFDTDYLADKHVLEQLMGSAELRDDHAVFVQSA